MRTTPPSFSDPILGRLRLERRRQGLSQTDVGKRLGHTTYGSVHEWETGKCEPTLSRLRSWAAALGYSVALVPLTDRGGEAGG